MLINDTIRMFFFLLVIFRAQFICAYNNNVSLASRVELCCVSCTHSKHIPVCANSHIGSLGNVL